jgi:hypothetical protein
MRNHTYRKQELGDFTFQQIFSIIPPHCDALSLGLPSEINIITLMKVFKVGFIRFSEKFFFPINFMVPSSTVRVLKVWSFVELYECIWNIILVKLFFNRKNKFFILSQNLDALHDHLGTLYPGMRAPSFRCTEINGQLILHYYSERPGLEHIVIGIVKVYCICCI